MPKQKLKAATLLEILIAIGIFMVISSLVMPVSIKQIQTVKIESVVKDMNSMISTAQQDSYNAKNNKTYGISFFSNGYIYYVGSSLAGSESQEVFNLPTNYTISSVNLNDGSSEFSFNKGSLKPSTSGNLTVTDGYVSYRLLISTEGVLQIQRI